MNRFRTTLARPRRYWHRRRSALEPITGHLKSECRLEHNRLKGRLGDQLNAMLAGCGLNFRKLVKGLRALFGRWFYHALISKNEHASPHSVSNPYLAAA